MICNINDLRNKQVVSIRDGAFLGYLSDLEIDVTDGKLKNLIIYGKQRAFGVFGREEDIVIPFENVDVIGKETILINDTFSYKK